MRRALAVPVVVLAALAAAGCSSVNGDDVAASVNGDELSQEDFEDMLVLPPAEGEDAPTTPVDGNTARERLGSWTILQILNDDLAATGTEVTDQDREDAAVQLESGDPNWSASSPALQEMLVDLQAAATVWAESGEPSDASDVQAAYEQGLEASGVACVAHILVQSEAEALAILDELDGGGDFATLAAENTTDTASAPSGGSLQCDTTSGFQQAYVPAFVDAALAGEVGVPTGPVATEFGYHIVMVRPYDDVSDDAAAIYDSVPARFRRLAAEADVHIDPRYGTWDPNVGVIALG